MRMTQRSPRFAAPTPPDRGRQGRQRSGPARFGARCVATRRAHRGWCRSCRSPRAASPCPRASRGPRLIPRQWPACSSRTKRPRASRTSVRPPPSGRGLLIYVSSDRRSATKKALGDEGAGRQRAVGDEGAGRRVVPPSHSGAWAMSAASVTASTRETGGASHSSARQGAAPLSTPESPASVGGPASPAIEASRAPAASAGTDASSEPASAVASTQVWAESTTPHV